MKISSLLLIVGVTTLSMTGCNHKTSASESGESNDSLPEGIALLTRAVADNDVPGFASMVLYPLQRPYPLADVADSAAMVAYYNTLMDDSLRNAIVNARPGDWKEEGWMGYSLGDGKYLWYSDGVYAIDHLSKKEKTLRRQLVEEEMASLYPSLRLGYTPEACFAALPEREGVFRIDRSLRDTVAGGHPRYRLCYYKAMKQLRKRPTAILYGQRLEEGTQGTIHYEFSDTTSETLRSVVYYPESEDGSILVATIQFTGSAPYNLSVAPAYWLTLLH